MELLSLFTKSLVFGSVKHRHQLRDTGEVPYINHPIEVADILARAGVTDFQILCAAILHDTVEDTATTPEEVEKEFGKRVRDIVMEATDDKSLGKVERKILQIKKSKQVSNEARLVKLADKISNNRLLLIEAPPKWSKQRTMGYFVWSEAVCAALKGLNEQLDLQIQAIFQKAGLNELTAEKKNEILQIYYAQLATVAD